MLGQRFLPTSYQAKLQQMDYEKHVKRLEQITKTSKSVVEEKEDLWRSTFDNARTHHQKFQASEKLITIDKTNQVLLDKLVKISKNQKPPLFKATTWTTHPGTLNTGFRKVQLEKIALENEAMAKRLISQHGSVNRRQLDKDFEKHQEFSRNVQKINSPKIDKLLPIRSPKFQDTSKGFKVKKKKTNKKNSASVQIDGQRLDLSKEDSKPSEEAQSREYMPATQTQEGGPDKLEKSNRPVDEPLNQSNDNDVTAHHKEPENEKKEEEGQTQAETKVKPEIKSEEEANSASKREKETEAKVEKETDTKVEMNKEEEKDAVKPQEVIQNKSQVVQENKSQASSHRSKKSTTIQPPANFEKVRDDSNRKGSSNNIDSKDNKPKNSAREVAQIPTTRSNNEMDKSQVEKSQLGKSQVEKSQVEKSQVEEPQVDKSQAEKSQVEKSQVEKSQVEKSQLGDSQMVKSQVEKSQLEKSQVEKSQIEKSARKSVKDEGRDASPVQSQRQKETLNQSQNQEEGKSQVHTQRKSEKEEEIANDQSVEEELQKQEEEGVEDINQNKSQEPEKEQEQQDEQNEIQEDGKAADE